MELSIREEMILEVLSDLKICRTKDLTFLCGYQGMTYIRKRLKEMEKDELIKHWKDNKGQMCFYLTK